VVANYIALGGNDCFVVSVTAGALVGGVVVNAFHCKLHRSWR
jgi:hypothetical protein